LFTYEGDVVLDPFMGSGTTAVAAVNTGRQYVGYDTDAGYVRQARERVGSLAPESPRDRRTLKELSKVLLADAGYSDVEENARISPGVTVSFRAIGPDGVTRLFEMGGTHTPARPGLSRIDAVWRTIAKAAIANIDQGAATLIVLTSGTVRGGPLAAAMADAGPIETVIDVTRDDAVERLLSENTEG